MEILEATLSGGSVVQVAWSSINLLIIFIIYSSLVMAGRDMSRSGDEAQAMSAAMRAAEGAKVQAEAERDQAQKDATARAASAAADQLGTSQARLHCCIGHIGLAQLTGHVDVLYSPVITIVWHLHPLDIPCALCRRARQRR